MRSVSAAIWHLLIALPVGVPVVLSGLVWLCRFSVCCCSSMPYLAGGWANGSLYACRLLNDHVFHVCLNLLLWCIVVWWVRSVLVTHHSAFAVTSCMLCTTCSLYTYIYISFVHLVEMVQRCVLFCSRVRYSPRARALVSALLGPSRPFLATVDGRRPGAYFCSRSASFALGYSIWRLDSSRAWYWRIR